MRTHGWSGAAPASDDEAIARILAAASKTIDAKGADFSIADVARALGVTRQTVYRYFPSTDALLVAAAVHTAGDFANQVEAHLRGITDPVDAVAEAIATVLEWLPKDKHLGLLIGPDRPNLHIESVTGDVALDFAHSMIRRFDVRIYAFDTAAAQAATRLLVLARSRGLGLHQVPAKLADLQIGGVAAAYGLTLATRNIADFQGLDLDLEDPWNAGPAP